LMMDDLVDRGRQLPSVVAGTVAMNNALHEDMATALTFARLPRMINAPHARIMSQGSWDAGISTMGKSLRYSWKLKQHLFQKTPDNHSLLLPIKRGRDEQKVGFTALASNVDEACVLARNVPFSPKQLSHDDRNSNRITKSGYNTTPGAESLHVVDSFEEEPEVVAQRIAQYNELFIPRHGHDSGDRYYSEERSRRSSKLWTKFQRVDERVQYQPSCTGYLMSGGTVLVRKGSSSSGVLVTSNAPINRSASASKAYFEICVQTIFDERNSIAGMSPELVCERRANTPHTKDAGLVLGVTLTPPAAISSSTKRARDVPSSWILGANGMYYVNTLGVLSTSKYGPDDRELNMDQSQHVLRSDAFRSHSGAQQLNMPIKIAERSKIGMLVGQNGSIYINTDGQLCSVMEGANVPTNLELYALVEMSGSIRSVKALPQATWPS